MLRNILYTVLLLFCIKTSAAPVLNVSDIYYNAIYDEWGVDIALENGDDEVSGLQFDIAIPQNFMFMENGYHFTERAQVLEGGKMVDTHVLGNYVHGNGVMRCLVMSFDDYCIQGTTGKILFIEMRPLEYITLDKTFKCNIVNQLITLNTEDITAVYPTAIINDKNIRCYDAFGNECSAYGELSQDDAEALNIYLGTNPETVTLDISYCTSASIGKVTPANNNLIIYAASRNQVTNNENVFWKEDENVCCNKLSIYDNSKSLEIPIAATAHSFSFDRILKGGQWNTIVLPISLSDEQLQMLLADGTRISKLQRYDVGSSELIYKTIDKFEANTPYGIKPMTDISLNINSDVEIKSTIDGAEKISVDGVEMCGGFSETHISSTDDIKYYGYDVATGIFRRVGKNALLKPFRCYIAMPVSTFQNSKATSVLYVNDDSSEIDITHVSSINFEDISKCSSNDVNIIGQRVSSTYHGIHVKGGKKYIK